LDRVGQETEVTDTDEAFGDHMEQEAPDEIHEHGWPWSFFGPGFFDLDN